MGEFANRQRFHVRREVLPASFCLHPQRSSSDEMPPSDVYSPDRISRISSQPWLIVKSHYKNGWKTDGKVQTELAKFRAMQEHCLTPKRIVKLLPWKAQPLINNGLRARLGVRTVKVRLSPCSIKNCRAGKRSGQFSSNGQILTTRWLNACSSLLTDIVHPSVFRYRFNFDQWWSRSAKARIPKKFQSVATLLLDGKSFDQSPARPLHDTTCLASRLRHSAVSEETFALVVQRRHPSL